MDKTFTNDSNWEVDIDELVAATMQEMQEREERPRPRFITTGFRFVPKILPPGVQCLWVKYQQLDPTRRAEAYTQAYVRTQLAKLDEPTRGRLYVPKIFDYAEARIEGCRWSFVIMDFVTGTPLSEVEKHVMRSASYTWELRDTSENMGPFKDRVVDAICSLLSLEPPPDTAPGPVNSGRIQSFVFGMNDSVAPCELDSLDELSDWVNEENTKAKWVSVLPTANFSSEDLMLCYCDPGLQNFLLEDPSDPASRLTIIDFDHTSWVPYSFLVWDLRMKREYYIAERVTSRSGLEVNEDNVKALHNLRMQRFYD